MGNNRHNYQSDLLNIFYLSSFLFRVFLKFTMNAPLFLSILIALVCAELVFSYRLKSLAEDKEDGMSDKIKAALQEDTDAKRERDECRDFGSHCTKHSNCCANFCSP